MSRVIPDEVRAIVETELACSAIQAWIDGANTVVNDNADCIDAGEDKLTQIELFLSAHFVGMLTPSVRGFVSGQKADVFDTTYSNPIKLSEVIDATPYGTTANMLAGGCLTSTTKRTAKFFALG